MEIVMGVIWGMKQPRFAAERSQPVRGILFSLIALVVGVVVALAHWTGVGGSISSAHADADACSDRFGGHHLLAGHHVGRLAIYDR